MHGLVEFRGWKADGIRGFAGGEDSLASVRWNVDSDWVFFMIQSKKMSAVKLIRC